MTNSEQVIHFFMSAVTPGGFVTHFSELTDPCRYRQAYLIKGAPGCGKSTLIRRAAAAAVLQGKPVEMIHCSADPQSLDAVVLGDVTLTDATAPHTLEPASPGLFERVISLYDFCDPKVLSQNKTPIQQAVALQTTLQKRTAAYVRAAGMLLASCERLAARCIDGEKLSNYIARFCMRELKKPHTGKGTERVRYLSALGENGVVLFLETAQKLCQRRILLLDDSGAASGIILSEVRAAALSMGYDVYSCPCPMSASGRLEHLLIPQLSLCLLTSNKFHPIAIEGSRRVHTARFFNREQMQSHSFRNSFQRRAARQLLQEASIFSGQWLENRRALEKYYTAACDFTASDRYFDRFLAEISAPVGQ